MGVTGLLQQLKEIQEPTSLSAYRGKTLAVDTFGWLHRGLISCAQDLCTDAPASGYVTSVMKKVDMLRHFGVEPYMVFDGAPLPAKEGTALERREKRERAREAALALTKKGDRRGAWKEYMKAAAVTAEMAKSVMVELDRRHVKYVVAPYEADPQMVYLEKIGAVDGILSEDLDLLVFGCHRLVTKLNDYGECIEICRANFARVKKVPRLHTYTAAQWRAVAILAGCDYTKGVPGVGLKTAFAAAARLLLVHDIVQAYRADRRAVPEDFLPEAVRADLAFQYQKVYDPAARQVRPLNPCPPDLGVERDALDWVCGRTLPLHVHLGVCTGRLHPALHTVLVLREQNLATKSRSFAARALPPAPVASKAHSFAALGAKTIESYFRAEKSVPAPAPVSAAPAPAAAPSLASAPLRPSKRVNTALSPTAKKLRKLQPAAPAGSVSKFFDAILTGDSDIPDLSPVKAAPDVAPAELPQESYLTDDDLDIMPVVPSERSEDDGYTNELDESPVKRVRLGQKWRLQFLLRPDTAPAAPAAPGPARVVSVVTKQSFSFRADLGPALTRLSIGDSRDDTASSLGPPTPNHVPPSLFKSLQISESEDEPRTFSLLRFAFRP